MKHSIIFILSSILVMIGCAPTKPSIENPNVGASSVVKSLKTVEEKGGRLSLSQDGSMIAFDRRGQDGYYDVWTMHTDGSNKKCITCDHPNLPTRNVGQPEWHPSGKYLIVQVEKQTHYEGIASKLSANPGAGIYNDLWAIEYKTDRVWQILKVPQGKAHGVLHPHFSKDGKKLSWSQSYKEVKLNDQARLAGSWYLKVVDFDIKPAEVTLKNIQTYQPGDEVFYENHGFNPDGTKLIFTSNLRIDQSLLTADIYTMDLATKKLNRLTTTGYNEHAIYAPDGSKIVWMTTNGNVEPDQVKEVGYTDWWIMNADGSDKKRLTYFNHKVHPHFVMWGTCAADFDWAPGSDRIFGYYHTATLKNILRGKFREVIVSIQLK